MYHSISQAKYYDSISSGYNLLHGSEQREKIRIIRDFIPDKKVLDVGCGSGISAEFYSNIVGIDVSLKFLKLAKLTKVLGFGEFLPFTDSSFDNAICVSAIHHFPNGILEIKRVAKNKGKIAITILKKSNEFINIRKSLISNFILIEEINTKFDIIFILKNKK